MKRFFPEKAYLWDMNPKCILAALALVGAACTPKAAAPTGKSVPDLGWLFLENGPYILRTHVEAAPGPATLQLVRDISLMDDEPEVLLNKAVTIGKDSTLSVKLGRLEPGFYEVRLRDSIRWNVGVRPDEVVSPPDARPDFDAFWEQTYTELAQVPLEVSWTEIPAYSNELRTCFEVRYPSWGGGEAGGIISIPVAEGEYPVWVQYMGYGAEPFYFDPSGAPERIDFLVSVRDQGIFKGNQERWIDRGLESKETFYYRGAFCDVRRAIDFVESLAKADKANILVSGESQGGAFSFISAAGDPRVKAIAPAVPFLGDYPDYARIVWWPVHEVFDTADAAGIPREELLETLSYFDVKNFAPKVQCPVYMSFGLQDPTCPPHTNFSIYNNLGTKDKRFYCVPTCGHAMWAEPSWSAERDAFLWDE